MLIPQLMTALNAAVNQISAPYQKGDNQHYAVQFTFSSATINGTASLQASVDGITYVQVAGSSQGVASGASVILNVSNANYNFVQAVWTASSGAGTVSATLNLVETKNRFN